MATFDKKEDEKDNFDPITDIIDYLVRCAKISFKTSHINQAEVKTADKINMACALYKQSPTEFLLQFAKHLAPQHIEYFSKLPLSNIDEPAVYKESIVKLKDYHSDECRHKRTRNRRYKALQKMQVETDYFSEKEMMARNPLLYEQLVGQFLTDDEIRERDGVDNENLTFLSMILETVDRNTMRETKNEQMLEEDLETIDIKEKTEPKKDIAKRKWGEFDVPDTRPDHSKPEERKQCMITAPERDLLKEEFLQEMYSSFIEGRDLEVDYHSIDNDEQYDDLQQMSRDAEDKYFDSEDNDAETLEEHMKLVDEYGKKQPGNDDGEDPLDVFMEHIAIKQRT